MSSISRVFAVPGHTFDAGVVHAGDAAAGSASPASAVAPAGIRDGFQTALAELLSQLTGEEKELCSSLLLARMDLNLRCRAVIERHVARGRARLVEEHEGIKRECVAQQERISALKQTIIGLEQDFQRQNAVSVRAMTKTTEAEQARKSLSRFASASEIKKADAAIETARHNLEVASCKEAPIREEINRLIFVEIPRANEKLRELSAAELRLRSAVTGAAFVDEQFGIQVPARPPAA